MQPERTDEIHGKAVMVYPIENRNDIQPKRADETRGAVKLLMQ